MIDYLNGPVMLVGADHIVIDVQGVGYRVFCPDPHRFYGKHEEKTMVYIHYHVREDAILLYGFADREEQTLFRKLIDVNGVGPKVALGMLGGARTDDIIRAIRTENDALLTRLPGIGKKTAQRIILDLKDKLAGLGSAAASDTEAVEMDRDHSVKGHEPHRWAEAKEGLKALGYKEAELDRIWPELKNKLTEEDGVDGVMRKALQTLFKP